MDGRPHAGAPPGLAEGPRPATQIANPGDQGAPGRGSQLLGDHLGKGGLLGLRDKEGNGHEKGEHGHLHPR